MVEQQQTATNAIFKEFPPLTARVAQFLASADEKEATLLVDAGLRRDVRAFSHEYKALHYVALGRGEVHALKLSKSPMELKFSELSLPTQLQVLQHEGMKFNRQVTREAIQHYVATADAFNGIAGKMQLYADAVLALHGEREMESHLRKTEQDIVALLAKSPNVAKLAAAAVDETSDDLKLPNKMLYTPDNAGGREYLAIDMRQANYQALRSMDRTFLSEPTWAEFLARRFTPHAYMHQCKQLRLRVLGNVKLQPKKQKALWESIVKDVYRRLTDEKKTTVAAADKTTRDATLTDDDAKPAAITTSQPEAPKRLFAANDLVTWNSDELVYRAGDDGAALEERVGNLLKSQLPEFVFRITRFTLHRLSAQSRVYYKRNAATGAIEFKCVQADQLPQCIKQYRGEEITEQDLAVACGAKMP